MAATKISPNRRKSIAAPTESRVSLVPKNRRRAHSIVPGAALSPRSKARRSLAPRKSILKSSVVSNVDPSSQQSTSTLEDNTIHSMDITQDLSAPVQDDTTRRSLGRRVSWAHRTHVKTFGKNSTRSQHSSPTHGLSITNENDYPGQISRRRRSSFRYSVAGSEDMDMTTIINPGGHPATGSAILEEEFDYGDHDDDMEITEAIQGNFSRKRSSSIGRQPLSHLQSPSENDYEGSESQSDKGDESMDQSISEEQSVSMEFTVPLGQSLRQAHQDAAWLALKQMTHSANEPTDEPTSDDSGQDHGEVGMNLEDAMNRLRHARNSLPLPSQPPHSISQPDDTFTSTEDSFEGDNDEGNITLNLSQVISRFSIDTNARMSVGYQDSNMDESQVYGSIAELTPVQSLQAPEPQSSIARVESTSAQQVKQSVFQPTSASDSAAGSSGFKKQISPSKTKQLYSPSRSSQSKPTFSAAFAPPVAKPSPKKSTASPGPNPAKRPRTTNDNDVDADGASRPSPAKKPVLANRWMGITAAREEVRNSPQRQALINKPKPLSPSRKAAFQNAGVHPSTTVRPSSGSKRQSGYFARRKSLAAGLNQSSTNLGSFPSPRKPSVDFRRLSAGPAPSVSHQFNKNLGLKDPSNGEENAGVHLMLIPTPVPVIPDPLSPSQTSKEPAHFSPPEHVEVVEQPVTPLLTITPPIEGSDIFSQGTEIDVEATQQWRDAVQQDDYVDEDETPAISISQFFQMTGIKYMDELAAPRRSLHPGIQPIPQSRNVSDIPLAEFVMAMAIDVPQLDLYSRVSKDLEAWIEKSKVVFSQAEEEAAKVTPELFIEYARADEVGREELGHQLTLIRTHTRYLARSDWYDWKLQWVEGLRHTASEAFRSLEDDARALEGLKTAADAILPELEKEYEQVMQELELEQAEVKEIGSCDQDYLNELKASIAEQNIEIEALRAELAEAMDQSKWVQEKLQEIDAQKNNAQSTIRTAERVLQMKNTSTRSEVFRLKAELESLEDLHMVRITKVGANLFEYVYASAFLVSIPCIDFRPTVSKIRITRSEKGRTRHKDEFPKLSTFLLSTANYLINEGERLNVREIVHRLADFWSACSQLRSQLLLLKVKYPVDILVSSPQSQNGPLYFKAKAQVLFPSVRAKAFVYFTFSFDTLTQWPLSLGLLNCEVEVAYGPVERSAILKAVMGRLSQITPAENYACLLDACIEAQDVYH